MRLALDAMGGDFGPSINVEGAVQAARELKYEIILVGREDILTAELTKYNTKGLSLSIHPATEEVGMDESPAQAVRQKKDSSLCVAARLVAEGRADAMVSAGNSGACMAASLMYMRRLPGVSRPAIASVFPSTTGFSLIVDVGANADCKPRNLLQFAAMGKCYAAKILDKKDPKIGLLSIGEEDSKGNELTLAAFDLMKSSSLNFIGNVEGRDIPRGKADVVVCDGFVGNIVLKFGEGLAGAMLKLVKQEMKAHPISWVAVPFLWPALGDLRKKVDYTEYGGAPLLGVDGICIIAHGGSNAKAIKNALRAAGRFAACDVNKDIAAEIAACETILSREEKAAPSNESSSGANH